MAGFFSTVRSLLGFDQKASSISGDNSKTAENPVAGSDLKVTEPDTFNISTARQGFYQTVLGDINDQNSLTVPQKLVHNSVLKSLESQEKRLKAVPRLPSIIPKLVQSLRDPNASAKDYVNIINKDPAMSTAVLKLANSVYFNPTTNRVTSIETAVVKLGIDGLRSVLSAAVMQPVIHRKSHFYKEFGQQLWSHSLQCAIACELIARKRALEPFKAYLLGLVHDIGKITIFSELSTQFQLNKDNAPPGYAAFVPLMQANSEQLSYNVACDWALPEEICAALQQQINLASGNIIDPYAHVLYQANLACEIYAILRQDPQQQEAAGQALLDMNLPANLFEQLDSISIEL